MCPTSVDACMRPPRPPAELRLPAGVGRGPPLRSGAVAAGHRWPLRRGAGRPHRLPPGAYMRGGGDKRSMQVCVCLKKNSRPRPQEKKTWTHRRPSNRHPMPWAFLLAWRFEPRFRPCATAAPRHDGGGGRGAAPPRHPSGPRAHLAVRAPLCRVNMLRTHSPQLLVYAILFCTHE